MHIRSKCKYNVEPKRCFSLTCFKHVNQITFTYDAHLVNQNINVKKCERFSLCVEFENLALPVIDGKITMIDNSVWCILGHLCNIIVIVLFVHLTGGFRWRYRVNFFIDCTNKTRSSDCNQEFVKQFCSRKKIPISITRTPIGRHIPVFLSTPIRNVPK